MESRVPFVVEEELLKCWTSNELEYSCGSSCHYKKFLEYKREFKQKKTNKEDEERIHWTRREWEGSVPRVDQ